MNIHELIRRSSLGPTPAEAAARTLAEMGGFLGCLSCGDTRELGDASVHLRDGWPMCCGYTMRWVTQK